MACYGKGKIGVKNPQPRHSLQISKILRQFPRPKINDELNDLAAKTRKYFFGCLKVDENIFCSCESRPFFNDIVGEEQ